MKRSPDTFRFYQMKASTITNKQKKQTKKKRIRIITFYTVILIFCSSRSLGHDMYQLIPEFNSIFETMLMVQI
jgi:hypothetical protein